MSFKGNKKIESTLKKIMITIILLFNLFSIVFSNTPVFKSEITQSYSYKNIPKAIRNLQFTANSIYYKTPFPLNNVTGTGDKLKDIPYSALCKILNCDSGCCVGEIDTISCGDKTLCDKYIDYNNYHVIAPAVIVPIVVILFMTLMILVFMKRNKFSFAKSLLLSALTLFVITIPCVLYYARKKADQSEIKLLIRKQKQEEEKQNISIENKKPQAASGLEKNEVLTINKLDANKVSSKSSSNKNLGVDHEYRKINENDELQDKSVLENELKIKQNNPVMNRKNESMGSDEMEVDGHFLTDPLRKKGESSNLISETDKDHMGVGEIENRETNKDNNKESQQNVNLEEEVLNISKNENEDEINVSKIQNNDRPEDLEEDKAETSSPEKEKERITDSLQRIKLLPLLKTPEDAAKRIQLFDRFDPNGSLYLLLSEADKGVREILSFNEKFLARDVIQKAFTAAKKSAAKKKHFSPDTLEKNEFRAFLVFLRQYAEYFEIFDLIENQEEKKQIDFEQFSVAVPIMQRWGIEIDQPKAAFDSIESSDGERILFDEFCFWAISKNLELENDFDFDDEELAQEAIHE